MDRDRGVASTGGLRLVDELLKVKADLERKLEDFPQLLEVPPLLAPSRRVGGGCHTPGSIPREG